MDGQIKVFVGYGDYTEFRGHGGIPFMIFNSEAYKVSWWTSFGTFDSKNDNRYSIENQTQEHSVRISIFKNQTTRSLWQQTILVQSS